LEADGVDTRSISRSSTRTGVAFITVEDMGQNSIVVVAGANGDLDEAAIDAASELIASADIVLAQFEVPIPSVARAFGHATGTVVLNPAPASRLDGQLLESVDYLIPNRSELATLAGSQIPRSDADVLASIKSLDFNGVVVVTLGSDGARVVHGGEVIASATPPPVDVVDTVGAGDAFCAGFCDALARNLSLPEAVTWATACGAVATTKHGAQPSMPQALSVLASVRPA
jgi:ribokinase